MCPFQTIKQSNKRGERTTDKRVVGKVPLKDLQNRAGEKWASGVYKRMVVIRQEIADEKHR